MCGIIAEHGGPGGAASTSDLERMLERLTHRGPDDVGSVRVGDSAWLGHRRLSIVDLETGKQPLSTDRAYLVGNGEVYNHVDVREQLGSDFEFRTTSDNEVALHLLVNDGPTSLARLNGMFAFVMASEDGRFVAARDPVGIKPLYWAQKDGRTLFSSEMHAFPEEWQPFVEPFPPGYAWTPEDGLIPFAAAVPETVEDFLPGPAKPGDPFPEELLAGTRQALVNSVERQMMGDVPVGVFLSGGLDSSLVAAIAAKYLRERGQTLKTFAVGTEGSPDLIAARKVAEHIGSEHHETRYTAEKALELLPHVVRSIESFDPGLVRSAVPNAMLAQLTVQHVKVVLTGEGADELFAGYDYYRDFPDPDDLHAELSRTVRSLHNLNLQRCDRVTMAESLEARVPFLDQELIEWALRVPPAAKLPTEERPEKALLREAFSGWLPDELLWRTKAEFGDGSGARDVLTRAVEATVSDEEFEAERHAIDPALRTKEEVAYYRVWRAHLAGVDPAKTLSRFARA